MYLPFSADFSSLFRINDWHNKSRTFSEITYLSATPTLPDINVHVTYSCIVGSSAQLIGLLVVLITLCKIKIPWFFTSLFSLMVVGRPILKFYPCRNSELADILLGTSSIQYQGQGWQYGFSSEQTKMHIQVDLHQNRWRSGF